MLFAKSKHFISIILFSLIFISCEKDNPISTHEDHIEAIGLAIFDSSDNQIFSILRGTTNDSLFAEVGKNSSVLKIKFYNDKEELFDAGNDPDHKFNWEFADNSFAEIQKSVDNEFSFTLKGLKAGITDLEFFIEHEGHADFRSGKFKLVVR